MPRLELPSKQYLPVPLVVNLAFERTPLLGEFLRSRSTIVVRVKKVLDHGLSRLEPLRIRNMLKPQHQVVGSGFDIFELRSDCRGILSSVTCAVLHCAIHTDARFVCKRPLFPPIVVLRGWVGIKMRVQNIGQRLYSQVAGVVLICWP